MPTYDKLQPKDKPDDKCVKCGEPAQTSPGYKGKTPKCPKHRGESLHSKHTGGTWDRWYDGANGSYNSDDD